MTIATICILIMGLMPIVFTGLAKFGGKGGFNNHAPRLSLAKLTGWRQRANWAQDNCFEAFPMFAAAVIVATLAHAPQHTLDILAICVVILRIIYGILYLADLALLRSLIWFISLACMVAMFFI